MVRTIQIIFIIILDVFLCQIKVHSQSDPIYFGNRAYAMVDRIEIMSGQLSTIHTSLKKYSRKHVMDYLSEIPYDTAIWNRCRYDIIRLSQENNEYPIHEALSQSIHGENRRTYVDSSNMFYTFTTDHSGIDISAIKLKSERPFLKYFYKSPVNFFEINEDKFFLRVNPVLNLKVGRESEESTTVFDNQRGLRLRGGIDSKVFFDLDLLESQTRFVNYTNNYIDTFNAIPGVGLYKSYNSSIFNSTGAYDYSIAKGGVGVQLSDNISVYLGHGNNFIGNGFRSLLLSDFSNNYFYLKLDTRIWKLRYQNIFAELAAETTNGGSGEPIRKKYMATHVLSMNLFKNVQVGIFESVIFNRDAQFELQYLNPIIFYRVVEQGLGSPDNVLLGLDGKWNIVKKLSIYGQVVIDEFRFKELINGNGWWANKLGYQVGIKYIDMFNVNNLDLGLEYNTVRPYTYSHFEGEGSYSHYGQPLAHPLGANFREIICSVDFRLNQKLSGRLISAYMQVGEDESTNNWGNIILTGNVSHVSDFGNTTLQGVRKNIGLVECRVSYELFPNGFIDLGLLFRNQDSDNDLLDLQTRLLSFGVRMNMLDKINIF